MVRADTHYIGYGLHIGFKLPGEVWLGTGIEGGIGHQVANAPNLKRALWRTFCHSSGCPPCVARSRLPEGDEMRSIGR